MKTSTTLPPELTDFEGLLEEIPTEASLSKFRFLVTELGDVFTIIGIVKMRTNGFFLLGRDGCISFSKKLAASYVKGGGKITEETIASDREKLSEIRQNNNC